jgi:hypothetical protein
MVAYRYRLINSLVWDVAVSELSPNSPRPKLPPLLAALAGVLLLEAVAMVAVAVLLLVELLTQPAASLGGALFLVVLAVLAAAGLFALFVGTIRKRGWTRGPTFVWQFVQLAIAVGAFQGQFARVDIGWLLLIPSVVAIALLFTPSVMNATRRSS